MVPGSAKKQPPPGPRDSCGRLWRPAEEPVLRRSPWLPLAGSRSHGSGFCEKKKPAAPRAPDTQCCPLRGARLSRWPNFASAGGRGDLHSVFGGFFFRRIRGGSVDGGATVRHGRLCGVLLAGWARAAAGGACQGAFFSPKPVKAKGSDMVGFVRGRWCMLCVCVCTTPCRTCRRSWTSCV